MTAVIFLVVVSIELMDYFVNVNENRVKSLGPNFQVIIPNSQGHFTVLLLQINCLDTFLKELMIGVVA